VIHPIVRLYDSAEKAQEAVRQLQARRFGPRNVDLVSPPADGGGADEAALAETIAEAHVVRGRASRYARLVLDGHWMVIARAPIGTGVMVTDLLDDCGPVETGLEETEDRARAWDESAPISSALQIGTIIRNPTPFSSFWALPVVAGRGRRACELIGWPELASSRWSLSAKLGMPLLSNNPTPLSSLLKLPLTRR
jgi:hypothetical protein